MQWAGITAGKHGSFYDYLAGGDTWKDFFSPDHSGTPINLLAYTATFGGGFSATVSLEQNESVSGFAGAAAAIYLHHLEVLDGQCHLDQRHGARRSRARHRRAAWT